MTDKKRVGIVLNSSVYDNLQLVAGRYGMTVNSLMAYILGQWVDANIDMKEKITEKVVQEMTKQAMDFENNPMAEKIVREVMSEVIETVKEKEKKEMLK